MKCNSFDASNRFKLNYYGYFPYLNRISGLHHYTSLPTLFNILEGDSFWVSNPRFSNDFTEEKMIGQQWIDEHSYNDDNYIICFCDNGDQLSQWRGYCNEDGVSIDMDFINTQLFSILHADFATTGKYEMCYNVPLPVNYVGEGNPMMQAFIQAIPDELVRNQRIKDLLPYFKHEKFFEERESRMVFNNRSNDLAKCIRYRDIGNHTKVPFMIVKTGNIGLNKASCKFEYNELTEENLNLRSKSLRIVDKIIIIPQGYDQEAVFSKVCSIIDKFNNSVKHRREKLKIFCEGHIPVRKITVSPMPGKERVKEQIEHFCRSIYWLRYVDVNISIIPFVAAAK